MRQKGESQNGCFKKAKHAKISEKMFVLFVCLFFEKCLFFGNFDILCFLETPVLRFALFPYYRQIMGFPFKIIPKDLLPTTVKLALLDQSLP